MFPLALSTNRKIANNDRANINSLEKKIVPCASYHQVGWNGGSYFSYRDKIRRKLRADVEREGLVKTSPLSWRVTGNCLIMFQLHVYIL